MPNGPMPPDLACLPDDWRRRAARDMDRVRRALGAACHDVHHVGSSSVPPHPDMPLTEAPVIDIAAEVHGPALPEAAVLRLLVHGFIALEAEPACRLFMVEDPVTGRRQVELRCYPAGHAELQVLVAFSAYLRRVPGVADEYHTMKRATRISHGAGSPAYHAAKRAWMQQRQAAVLEAWRLA